MSEYNTGNSGEQHDRGTTCSVTDHRNFRRMLRAACSMLALALPLSAVAQTHFCIGGDAEELTPARTVLCQEKMAAIRAAVIRHGAPADWHFVIVCDEEGWKEYTSFSGGNAARLEAAGFSTDPRLRWTFLRASDVDLERPESAAALLDTALEGLPRQKASPRLAPAGKASRRLSLAMAEREPAPGEAQ